jgi:large subunit ribosomal protein L10
VYYPSQGPETTGERKLINKFRLRQSRSRDKPVEVDHSPFISSHTFLDMAQTKQQKVEIVKKLEEAFRNAASTVFVHFKGVNITEETQMRRELKAANVKYTVAKKTLIKRALEALGHKTDDVQMDGEVAVAYGGGEDMTAPARLMHEYGKKFLNPKKESKLSILGGIFEGVIVGQVSMREIATIPPMQTLRGMFANIINSPRQRFAVVLSKVAESKN